MNATIIFSNKCHKQHLAALTNFLQWQGIIVEEIADTPQTFQRSCGRSSVIIDLDHQTFENFHQLYHYMEQQGLFHLA